MLTTKKQRIRTTQWCDILKKNVWLAQTTGHRRFACDGGHRRPEARIIRWIRGRVAGSGAADRGQCADRSRKDESAKMLKGTEKAEGREGNPKVLADGPALSERGSGAVKPKEGERKPKVDG
ncbi:hypothetical protein RB195_004152 [Necator americanus]|uniref:Uncharacterized protein n=1 Tax=Necator americanus TaxID=51031 RepID=A0ABR1BGK7_NECAM